MYFNELVVLYLFCIAKAKIKPNFTLYIKLCEITKNLSSKKVFAQLFAHCAKNAIFSVNYGFIISLRDIFFVILSINSKTLHFLEKMKFTLTTEQYSNTNIVILPNGNTDSNIQLICDDSVVATEIYNEILTNYNLEKSFTSEDFNEVFEHASQVSSQKAKKCNLALAVYNQAGCFVAQMGNTRILQIRPVAQEILYDSRSQVFDIYSSKAKVELLKDYKAGDYLMLYSIEDVDEKAVRKTICNLVSDHDAKVKEIGQSIKKVKDANGENPAVILTLAQEVKSTMLSFDTIKPKYIGYGVAGVVALILAIWLICAVASSGSSGSSENVVSEDTLVTDKSPNLADTVKFKKDPVVNDSDTEAKKTNEDNDSDGEKKAKKKKKSDDEDDGGEVKKESEHKEQASEEKKESTGDSEAKPEKKGDEEKTSEKKSEQKSSEKKSSEKKSSEKKSSEKKSSEKKSSEKKSSEKKSKKEE